MHNLCPTRGPHAAHFRFSLQYKTTSLYFDVLKCDVFDAWDLSATLSRLYCVAGNFRVATDTLGQNLIIIL